jgi:hypothetical protein
MTTKVISGPQVSKDQSKRLEDVSDRLSKRAKDPEDYNATVQDIAEVDRLTIALEKAVDKITKR